MNPQPQYIPKELKKNVNVSHSSPIKELFLLLGGILAIALSIYVALGFAVDYVASEIPVEVEQKLGILFSKALATEEQSADSHHLQQILDGLTERLPEGKGRYQVYLVTRPEMNALALPGGNIIVFSGLLKEVKSENELAFVLAHELGHFANRDHLRGLGRGLVLLTLSAALFGGDSATVEFIMNSLINVEMKFSQRQEQQADLWAIDLLNKTYGQVPGARDFIERITRKEKMSRFLYYFATHPYPQDRLKALNEHIEKKGYMIDPP